MWQIDKYSRVPIYEQVVEMIERYVMQGVLQADEQIPSVRMLSQSMGVNPNTLQKAYAQLEHHGICYAVPGSGRFICQEAKALLTERKRGQLGALCALAKELLQAGVPLSEMIAAINDVGVALGTEGETPPSQPEQTTTQGGEQR